MGAGPLTPSGSGEEPPLCQAAGSFHLLSLFSGEQEDRSGDGPSAVA